MTVKAKLLEMFERSGGSVLSGEEIAKRLSVSRAAVWKAMKGLRDEGYAIHASSNKGYWMDAKSDILSSDAVRAFLENKDLPVHCHRTLDSTNPCAMRLAMEGAPHGTIVLADEQTQGRGRKGRSFFSPARRGVYMSVVLRPDRHLSQAVLVTVAAAVAVCRVIESLTDVSSESGVSGKSDMPEAERWAPRIKWVNDIVMDGRKICGILTEAVSDFESGTVESMVVGIGVNLATGRDDFPPELSDIAGVVHVEGVSRGRFAAEIANRLLRYQANLSDPWLIEEYRERSIVLGRTVRYEQDGRCFRGNAMSINERGNLVVEDDRGELRVLQSGEISIEAM